MVASHMDIFRELWPKSIISCKNNMQIEPLGTCCRHRWAKHTAIKSFPSFEKDPWNWKVVPRVRCGCGWEGITHGDHSRSLSASLCSCELIGLWQALGYSLLSLSDSLLGQPASWPKACQQHPHTFLSKWPLPAPASLGGCHPALPSAPNTWTSTEGAGGLEGCFDWTLRSIASNCSFSASSVSLDTFPQTTTNGTSTSYTSTSTSYTSNTSTSWNLPILTIHPSSIAIYSLIYTK